MTGSDARMGDKVKVKVRGKNPEAECDQHQFATLKPGGYFLKSETARGVKCFTLKSLLRLV